MNWITGIQRALDYVEAHLMESVDYEEAAKQAYSSSFHFQRVFSILCGFTLETIFECGGSLWPAANLHRRTFG